MSRFLKKRLKSSQKLVAPDNPTQQTTETDGERGRDFEGEYRWGRISVGEAGGADSTSAPDVNHGGGSFRVVRQETKIENQQLPVSNSPTLTPMNTGGNSSKCGRL